MDILGLTNNGTNFSGCDYHRILLPIGTMKGIKGACAGFIQDVNAEGWDIVIYNRISQHDKNWNEIKKTAKCKVVLDLDDYWHLPPNHFLTPTYEDTGFRIDENIASADLITVTHQHLAERVYPFNKNVAILENAIPFGQLQFIDNKMPSDKIRIFWSGSITHEYDLKILRNPLSRLSIHRNKIEMVLGGYNDCNERSKTTWDRILSSFTVGRTLPYKILNGVDVTQYMDLYNHADICLIPLENVEWTSYKSNLKLLEAASKRIPCIVSDVAPYNIDTDAPVLWVKSQKDWFAHLNYLILHPKERIELGNKLYDWAKEKYDIEKVNTKRYITYKNLLTNG